MDLAQAVSCPRGSCYQHHPVQLEVPLTAAGKSGRAASNPNLAWLPRALGPLSREGKDHLKIALAPCGHLQPRAVHVDKVVLKSARFHVATLTLFAQPLGHLSQCSQNLRLVLAK